MTGVGQHGLNALDMRRVVFQIGNLHVAQLRSVLIGARRASPRERAPGQWASAHFTVAPVFDTAGVRGRAVGSPCAGRRKVQGNKKKTGASLADFQRVEMSRLIIEKNVCAGKTPSLVRKRLPENRRKL
jgi:hypothetical protein